MKRNLYPSKQTSQACYLNRNVVKCHMEAYLHIYSVVSQFQGQFLHLCEMRDKIDLGPIYTKSIVLLTHKLTKFVWARVGRMVLLSMYWHQKMPMPSNSIKSIDIHLEGNFSEEDKAH